MREMVTVTISPTDTTTDETKEILEEMGPQFAVRVYMDDPPEGSIIVSSLNGAWHGYLPVGEIYVEQRPGTNPSDYLDRKLNPPAP